MKSEEICFICSKNQNLTLFKVSDKRNYQELTGFDILKLNKLQICEDCRQNLFNSLKFLRLCKKSYQNFQNEPILEKEDEEDDSNLITSEISIQNEENFTSDNFILNEDVPVEIINEQIVEQTQEIIEVIEIQNITESHDKIDSKFTCQICDAQFSTNQKLKIHSLKHSGVKDYICSYDACDKQFATELRLKAHMRVHTNEKPYECDWDNCNMKFAQCNALLCHKRIHLNEKPYVCQVCGKRFTQNTTLKTHFAAKHGGNQILCDHPGCTKKFPRNSFLLLHKKRDHENIRNYNCDKCGKQYKQKSHLDRHIEAAHENIRHQCQYCEKSFSKSWSLKLHLFKHTEASNFPYKCSECEMSFQRRDTWIKHMSKSHPGIDIKRDAIEITVPKDIINKEMLKVT